MAEAALRILDDDGRSVVLDAVEAASLLELTGGLDAATVSACPDCASRILAVVALEDLLRQGAPHPRALDLLELAEDAPTLHAFVVDGRVDCAHGRWHDPGFEEWEDVVGVPDFRART